MQLGDQLLPILLRSRVYKSRLDIVRVPMSVIRAFSNNSRSLSGEKKSLMYSVY